MPRPQQLLPHDAPSLPTSGDWQTSRPVSLLRNVLRLTAPNPGVMTGPGTNSYLVGDASTGFTVIDPGPADADHLQRLWQAAVDEDGAGGNILRIVCTHSHPDHSPGAAPLQALCAGQPPILGLPSAPTARAASAFTPDRLLSNQELLGHISLGPQTDLTSKTAAEAVLESPQSPAGSVHTLQVIYTPGHAANHVCLLLQEDGLLFTGDHVLNGSTTVIDPPDGNMADYMDSLDKLTEACTEHHVQYILPAHGHVMDNALGAIGHLKAHRLKREAKIAAVMQAKPLGNLDDWLPLAYDDVDPRIWPAAKRSLMAHVERIYALNNVENQKNQEGHA
jgi:recombination protein RecT